MNARILGVGIMLCLPFVASPVLGQATPPAQDPKAKPAQKRTPRTPATPADLEEMAKLKDLPAYTPGAGDGDYFIGPNYVPAPEQAVREGVPKGKIVRFTMNSAESKIFPGQNGPFERAVAVYIPAQYVAGTPAPLSYRPTPMDSGEAVAHDPRQHDRRPPAPRHAGRHDRQRGQGPQLRI